MFTTMVYIGVEVMACGELYGDYMKVGATTNIPH
jgi:hypothetical protein